MTRRALLLLLLAAGPAAAGTAEAPEPVDFSGTWTVTVTATWTVSWALSTGETGSQQLRVQSSTPVHVGEWHVVLVNGSGG